MQRIRDEFFYEKVYRPGQVTRRIQELVNEYTTQWVSDDEKNAYYRVLDLRPPSPTAALADARRLTPAPSRVPAGMQGIRIPNTASMDRRDTHRPRTGRMINLEEPEQEETPELDLTDLPGLEPLSEEEAVLTDHTPTDTLTEEEDTLTEGSLSPSESRIATGEIWDDPRYANVTMPTVEVPVPAPTAL